MKILVLSNLYPPHYVGGYELHCQTVVEALRRRGHTVEVLTSNHTVGNVESSVDNGVTRALKIHGFFGHPFLGILQLQKLEKHNNSVLRTVLERFQPELVYIWCFGGLSKSVLLTLQKTGIPTVFAVCDHWIARSGKADVWLSWWNREDATPRHQALRRLWELSGYRGYCNDFAPTNPVRHLQFQRIHFCSGALRDLTRSAGFAVEHGKVIYCPVNTTHFKSQRQHQRGAIQKLLYVGRLNSDKGIMTALEAMRLLRGQTDLSLSVVGGGEAEFEAKLRAFVEVNQLNVTFTPPVRPANMPEVYAEHDALLFTSIWPEPFALAPLEAMACGLPVIGTPTGGSAELFRHGENSLVYAPGNAAELAGRILELKQNPELCRTIAKTGHDEVHSRFSEEIIINQVEDYLQESLRVWKPSDLPHYDS